MATDKILQQILVPAMDHQTDLIQLISRPVLPNKLIAALLLFRMIPGCFKAVMRLRHDGACGLAREPSLWGRTGPSQSPQHPWACWRFRPSWTKV